MRRRRFLTATGVAAMGVPLAGCGGDSTDSGEGTDDETTDTADGTSTGEGTGDDGAGSGSTNGDTDGEAADTPQGTPVQCDPVDGPLTGEVTGVPDELELVETEASRSGVNYAASGVQVKMTFRVTGDETIEPDSYFYDLTVYDADDNVMSQGSPVLSYQSTIEPGNTGPVFVSPIPSLDCPSEAARYVVSITA